MRSVFVAIVASVALVPQAPAPSVGFAPTALEVADAMLRLARVTRHDVVYDLGSGDGRIVILAAQKYGARAVGVELQPHLVALSRDAARKAGVAARVTFIEGDLFRTDISAATVVTMYLWPTVNRELEAKLRGELRPGARIVSNSFGIGKWNADQTARAPDGTQLLLWRVPRRPVRTPDVEFDPTPPAVVDEMLQLAAVGPKDVVYDLGSGDGRIVITAAQKYGARAVGVEIDPRLVGISRQVAREGEVARASFIEGDFLVANITRASVVTLSLSADVNARLEQKLRRELRPGTRIVSRRFAIGEWKPAQSTRASDGGALFVYVVPPR